MGPRRALFLASAAEFSGPFLFGVAVATTIGKGLIAPEAMTLTVILAALGSAILWNLLTWYFGLPSSSSHALVGGLAGAVIIARGLEALQLDGLVKVLLALFISPPLGFGVGYIVMKGTLFLARGASPKINTLFKRLQLFTSIALALSHGTNDAQKTMGIITMSLVGLGFQQQFAVPWWVIALSSGAMATGIATGGWRIIKTLGGGMYRMRPIHGFTAQSASAAVILAAALLGGPVSTTHVVSSAIMGVGSAERLSKVRWGLAGQIVSAWLITIPVASALAAILYVILRVFFGA
jgi:PiT family inorganic phosphate transporter